MKIHEYQAKELLIKYGVNAQVGAVVTDVNDAAQAAQCLGGEVFVVKAQVHAGGRGKAGGVKLCRSLDEVTAAAQTILGMQMVTPQTGADGKIVNKILIDKGVKIAKEFYLSITMADTPVVVASGEGGTEIEETAATNRDAIVRQVVPFETGLKDYHARNVGKKIGIPANLMRDFSTMLKGMYRVFTEKDCSLVEINPLVITEDGTLLALDAKMSFDDNALFRHPDVLALRDEAEEDVKEAEAAKYGLSYVSLDGDIGCMVNGAGLAMATMDIIKAYGGRPANFLDVGGSASAEKVAAAFKILLADKNVKAILVNIFGGIMKCDVIAEGIISAAKEVNLAVQLVVRLDGTNVNEGKERLRTSGLKLIAAGDLGEAARVVCAAVGGV
ncbi:MAG: ADP-forming succinate--CoA ligase subunit beta [Firmicutes bacterium]|nr:ADP-forming succinate--CoA ligase subunit beta [Bacillota bacterium]